MLSNNFNHFKNRHIKQKKDHIKYSQAAYKKVVNPPI